MRVYHFVDEHYGLQDLKEKHLKIALINELNDPFEFMGVDLSSSKYCQAMENMKVDMSTKHGILCFSENWENPVQWAHYANRHKGICLGFDVPDKFLTRIKYCDKRLSGESFFGSLEIPLARIEAEMNDYIGQPKSRQEFEKKHKEFLAIVDQRLREESETDEIGKNFMAEILSTKYSHWKYEKEYRVFRELSAENKIDDLYFAVFSEELELKEVIVGVRSCVTRAEVTALLGQMTNGVDIFKASEDFCEFSMVRDEGNTL